MSDQLYKFSMSALVRADERPDAPILGVVGVSILSDPTLGLPQLHDQKRKAALVGLEDPTSAAGEPGYVLVVHPAYRESGERAVAIRNEKLLEVQTVTTDGDYRDPVYGDGDRWLSAFARVGDTHLIVIVQQRYEDAIGVEGILAREIVVWVLVALGVGAMLMATAAWYERRRRRDL